MNRAGQHVFSYTKPGVILKAMYQKITALSPWKLTWHWKITMFNRRYIFKCLFLQIVTLVFGSVVFIVANVGSTSSGPNEVFPLACMMLTIAARFEAPRKNIKKVTGDLYLSPRFLVGELKALSTKLTGAKVFCWSKSFCVFSIDYTVSNLLKCYLGWDMMKQNENDTTRVQKVGEMFIPSKWGTVYSVRSRYHITDTSPNLSTFSTIPFLRWRIPLPDPRDRAKIKSEIRWHCCSFIPSQDMNIIDIIVDIHTSFHRL